MPVREESLEEVVEGWSAMVAEVRGDIFGVDGADTSCRASATANNFAIDLLPARCALVRNSSNYYYFSCIKKRAIDKQYTCA